MNTTPHSSLGSQLAVAHEAELKVNTYDRVAGGLIALLALVGVAVLLMFTLWLTAVLVFDKQSPKIEHFAYAGDSPDELGLDGEMDEPGQEDLEELKEPAIETTLIAVTELVTSQAGALDALEREAVTGLGGLPKGQRRKVGPVDDWDPNVIPPWQRWEIRLTTTDIDSYARQLDFFGIELGAVGGGSSAVQYACNLVKPKPDSKRGNPENEKRMYMTWREGGGGMANLDRQLLARAGIATDRRVVLQFYPTEVEKQLLRLEARAADEKMPSEYLKTVFAVRSAGSGYEFYVVDQTFRPPPDSPH